MNPHFINAGAFLGQVPLRGMGQGSDCQDFADAVTGAKADLDALLARMADLNSQLEAATDNDTFNFLSTQVDPLTKAIDYAKAQYDQAVANYNWCVNSPGSVTQEMGRARSPNLGQVPLRLGQFDYAPLSEGEVAAHQGYAMVNPLALAYTTGAYIRQGAPEWGRFPVMPPGVTYRV